jgi:hypothetical protein
MILPHNLIGSTLVTLQQPYHFFLGPSKNSADLKKERNKKEEFEAGKLQREGLHVRRPRFCERQEGRRSFAVYRKYCIPASGGSMTVCVLALRGAKQS